MRFIWRAFSRYAILWIACMSLGFAKFFPGVASITRLNTFFICLLILTAGLTLAEILVVIVQEKIGKGPMDLPATTLTVNLIRYTVFAISLLMILSVLGIAIAPLLTALGVGSLAVALGFQETLSNFFAGIYILKSQIIQPGDYIKLDSGQEGFVVDVGLRAIHLRTLSHSMVYVPTSKISQSMITNFSHPTPEFTTPIDVQVDFDTDLEKMERLTIETAQHVARRLSMEFHDPPATVRLQGYGDSGIKFTIFLCVKEMETRLLLVHKFLKELTRRYAEQGIHLSLPQRTVRLLDHK